MISYLNADFITVARSLPSVIKALLSFFLLVNIVRDRKLAIFALKAFLIIMTLSAIAGILQELLYKTTNIAFVGLIQKGREEYMWKDNSFGHFLRVPAFSGWYIVFSGYLLISIIVSLNLRLYSIIKDKKHKCLVDIAILLMSVALLFTFSNSAFLSLGLLVGVSILIRWRRHIIHILAVSILVMTIGMVVLDHFHKTKGFTEDVKAHLINTELAIRIELLREGISGFSHRHPFIGIGLSRGVKYTSDPVGWPVHNNFVLVADEIGMLGVFVYYSFFIALIGSVSFTILSLKDKTDKNILLSLLLGLITYMVNLQAQPAFIESFLFIYLGLLEATRKVMRSHVDAGVDGPA